MVERPVLTRTVAGSSPALAAMHGDVVVTSMGSLPGFPGSIPGRASGQCCPW